MECLISLWQELVLEEINIFNTYFPSTADALAKMPSNCQPSE